jgi:hydroxymethylglutaryl-CoA lyase
MTETTIQIHEVGLRDGLQMESEVVPTKVKLDWIEALLDSGVDVLQLGSFVRPRRVPQMADTDELFIQTLQAHPHRHSVLSGLALNEKGLERGLACGTELFCLGVSASETHSLKNTGMGTGEATTRILSMARLALGEGKRVQVSVQSAFGCGYEGAVGSDRVLEIVDRYLEAGLTEISLADTAGHGDPAAVHSLFEAVRQRSPHEVSLACHFHNTYGMALANCAAALEEGVTCFESSLAGLGGCPFTAVAGGNVCTEDLVHMLQRMGLCGHVRLPVLIGLARRFAQYFGRDLPGSVYRTGAIGED